MGFIVSVLNYLSTKLWIATIGRWRGYQAQKRLEAFTKTLSPKNREWALELRAKLESTKSADQSTAILSKEMRELSEKQMRLIERIDRAKTKMLEDRESTNENNKN